MKNLFPITAAHRLVRLLVMLMIPCIVVSQLPSPELISQASRSVVRVHATSSAENRERVGTGFLWQNPNTVVTALHVVAGCEQISVYSEHAGRTVNAGIERILKSADIALLVLDEYLNQPVLRQSTYVPQLNDDLLGLGYQLRAPSMGSTTFKLSYGHSELERMLPYEACQEVSRVGMPSLSLRILRLQGHLVPGLSGAPIIDRTGGVVAIGDGGLEYGAAEICWGVPISNVQHLLTSTESITQTTVDAVNLFSADIDYLPGNTLQCANMTFTKLRTRTYHRLATSTDDPASLAIFEQIASLVNLDVSQMVFDVYVHLESGATIVLPHDIEILQQGDGYIASEFDGMLQIYINGVTQSNLIGVRESYENQTYGPTGLHWQLDPYFSYPTPQTRFDYFEVDRTSYIGFYPDDPYIVYGMGTPIASAFQTLIARDNTFVGVVVFNYNPESFNAQLIMQKYLIASEIEIIMFESFVQRWIEMMFAVFLSTFAIG